MSTIHPVVVARAAVAFTLSHPFRRRLFIAVLLTAFDAGVLLKVGLSGYANSEGMPFLRGTFIVLYLAIAITLADVWRKTIRSRNLR